MRKKKVPVTLVTPAEQCDFIINGKDMTSKVVTETCEDSEEYTYYHHITGEDLTVIAHFDLWDQGEFADARLNVRVENGEGELLFFGESEYYLEPDEAMKALDGALLFEIYEPVYLEKFYFNDTFKTNPVVWVETTEACDKFYLAKWEYKEVKK